MMSGGDDAGGFNKSRSVLGDVTNLLGKRGFSEREKSWLKSNDNDIVKHVRVELNLFKGDVLSKISNASTENNNEGINVQNLDRCCAFSERSIGIEAELTCGYGNGEEINGDNAVNLCEKKAEFPSVSPLFDIDNGSVKSLVDMSSSVHDAWMMMDKTGSQKCTDPSFTGLEIGRAINSVDPKTCDSRHFGKFDSCKGYKMLEIPNAATENMSSNRTGTVKRNVVDVARNSSTDVATGVTKISQSSYLDLLDLGGDNALRCSNNIKATIDLGDVVFANAFSAVNDCGSCCLLDCVSCYSGDANVSLEVTKKNCIIYRNEIEGHNADSFITSQSDSIDCAILPDSRESRIFGVEKSNESCKEYPRIEAIKTCPCSFCTKAAYIWLDLNYQDIRGRVSALRKSQKEANILAERISMTKETEKHDAEGFTRISKLEIDLMHQWKFLFQHMAGIWEQEGDHLETSLSTLTDMRDKCKRDLGSD